MDEDQLYFEFEISFLDAHRMILFVREITQVIRSQQKMSDKMY